MTKLRWIEPPPAPIHDVIGRPALPFLATPRQRLAGAALGIALTAASLLQLLIT
jgi:hypothetical protein